MNVNINRQVFNKSQFENTINTQFTELKPVQDPTFFDLSLATIEDFFTLYSTLFFEIPKEGETNSHNYLIRESIEYTNFIANQEEIDALLAEIEDLRIENTDLRNEQASLIENFSSALNNQP